MTGRPPTRVETLDSVRLDLLRRVFGTPRNAFRALSPFAEGPAWSFWQFRRAFNGEPVTPACRSGIESAWGRWRRDWESAVRDAGLPLAIPDDPPRGASAA